MQNNLIKDFRYLLFTLPHKNVKKIKLQKISPNPDRIVGSANHRFANPKEIPERGGNLL